MIQVKRCSSAISIWGRKRQLAWIIAF